MSASRKMLDENISKLEISLLGRAVHHAERGESHLYRSEERLPSILPSRTTYLRTRVWGAWGCIRLPETRFRSFGNWISSTAGRLLIRLRLTIHIRGYDFYDFSSARLIKYFPDYFPWIVTDFESPVLPQGENVELGYRGRHWERARTTFQKQAQRHFTLRPRVSPRRTKRQSSPQGPLAIQPR